MDAIIIARNSAAGLAWFWDPYPRNAWHFYWHAANFFGLNPWACSYMQSNGWPRSYVHPWTGTILETRCIGSRKRSRCLPVALEKNCVFIVSIALGIDIGSLVHYQFLLMSSSGFDINQEFHRLFRPRSPELLVAFQIDASWIRTTWCGCYHPVMFESEYALDLGCRGIFWTYTNIVGNQTFVGLRAWPAPRTSPFRISHNEYAKSREGSPPA